MHICFISNEYPKEGFPHGGVGTFLKTIAPKLVEAGHKVSVVGINYTSSNETSVENGVTIYRLKKNNKKGLTWWLNAKAVNTKIKEINLESPIDIVESAELGLAFIKKIKTIKYVIRLHGGHHFFAESENRGINKWKGFQEKRSFKKADAFIAVSNYVKDHTAKYLSLNKLTQIIFYPVNNTHFTPLKNVSYEKNSIVFAGTVCEKKGVRQLIQAFPFVKEKYPEAILNIYGRDWFFPNGSSYIEMLKTKELPKIQPFDSDVYFKGTVSYDEIPEVYAKAEVCVFPSHMETLGLVAPEAMLCEKPVVFTKLGPGPEVIEDGYNGYLANPYEAENIASQILKVFDNQEKAKSIAEKGRQSILEKFNPEVIVQQNIDFYNKI
ncbi:MAG: glycosyltransferase family 4 protein [Flavobacterium sp.]|nr:glycosyltransferase family 4 protein [Flavobacterium sp.]